MDALDYNPVNLAITQVNVVAPTIVPLANQIETLTHINLHDMLDNFGLSNLTRGRRIIERIFHSPARMLAQQVAQFDRRVGEIGLTDGARELLTKYVGGFEIIGAENVPTTGGVVIAANHPGMTDTLACFTSVPRNDLYTVSADRPFVRALPNIAQRIFWVADNPNERLAVVRQVSRYLHNGGAVLICPAGQIEPDPTVMPGAIESLKDWSDSLGLFVRLAPASIIVPTVVSGVIYGPSLHNPLTRLHREKKERERIAATIQAGLQSSGIIRKQMRVKVEFGVPLCAAELISLGDAAAITRAVTKAIERIIVRHGPQSSNL